MTTLSPRSLVRMAQAPVGNADGTAGSTNGSCWFYHSESTFGQIMGAGYFNAFRNQLAVGDIIIIGATANKGGVLAVVAVPASGNVTTTAALLS